MRQVMLLPNLITCSRILLIPVFIGVMLSDRGDKNVVSALIFIVIASTDWVDGYLARRKNQITPLGKLLDPIADKLLVITALVLLRDLIPLWIIVLIALREVLVTLIRLLLLHKPVIEAKLLGKVKTASQMIGIVAMLLGIPYALLIMYLAAFLTLLSGIDFGIKLFRKS